MNPKSKIQNPKFEGNYYLGRLFDPQAGQTTDQPILYDPDDLTTHGVVVGMTGSGKTGLCLDLLEEAALNGLPALMIDPKGDITNAVLHFPGLAPADFLPWVNSDQARREGKTAEQMAADTAALWQKGLSDWGIGPERIQALKDSVQFTIFTPGSDAGVPVNILASLKAPPISWESNRELLREKIAGTVTALLGLAGLGEVDPVRSREHILLANIFEHAWSQGRDLNLAEIILQVQTPPFEKLGVFDVNTFFPEKERFELAMTLNNLVAAPTFQSWLEGQPLDVASLLYTPDGRPRHSIFYIAHLSDAERMFFVSLLFSAAESWMRTQSGTASLRALIYFDEIFGYLPPIANPPSKETMLRMLKQARAFGVGLLLATQNPVDVDYKALSNAGTWFIGRLQTDQDKQRLLDGLTGAVAGLDRQEYDALLSRLGKRVFLLHNVHEKQPVLFQTRWAMNYLAGPMTRSQIPALNALAGVAPEMVQAEVQRPSSAASPTAAETPPAQAIGSATRPALPPGVKEYFLPNNLTLSEALQGSGRGVAAGASNLGLLYRPVLLALADVRFSERKYNLNHALRRAALVVEPDRRGLVRWEEHLAEGLEAAMLDRQPAPEARFAPLEDPFSDGRLLNELERDFADWLYRGAEVTVRANEALKVYGGPEMSEAEFARLCQQAAAEAQDAEAEKVAATYERKLDSLKDKLARERRELATDEADLSQRKREEGVAHLETLWGLFSKRRRSFGSSMTKRRLTQQAGADVEESQETIAALEAELKQLEEERAEALAEVEQRWQEVAEASSEIPLTPYKKDINVELFGVAWMPYYRLEAGGATQEMAAYGQPT